MFSCQMGLKIIVENMKLNLCPKFTELITVVACLSQCSSFSLSYLNILLSIDTLQPLLLKFYQVLKKIDFD